MAELKDLRIVFMGTPEFAVASLDALMKAGANIVGVITGPDKPAGRGMKITQSAVKTYALDNDLTILQPEKLRNPEFLNALKTLNADLQVVVAFRMLPESVWNMPRLGTINLHGSLLPQYRGAAPINWAIINGEKETGVTTFLLQQEIDTGNMLLQERMPIGPDDTAEIVHDNMMKLGARTLVETVKQLAQGNANPIPQNNSLELKPAPKIFKEDCKIDWNRPIDEIHNFIRGLSPYPGAFTSLNGKTLKIFIDSIEKTKPHSEAGTWETDNKKYIRFAATDGYIYAKEIQPEGKKRMSVEDYLRGNQIH